MAVYVQVLRHSADFLPLVQGLGGRIVAENMAEYVQKVLADVRKKLE